MTKDTEAKVTLVEDMQFVVETGSGHAFTIDSVPEVGGRDTGPRPIELMAAAVAGCTAMDTISILRKMQQKVTALSVQVTAERASEHPKKILGLAVEYTVTGYGLAEDKVSRAVELSETKYCPAMGTLQPIVPINTKITILEADSKTMSK